MNELDTNVINTVRDLQPVRRKRLDKLLHINKDIANVALNSYETSFGNSPRDNRNNTSKNVINMNQYYNSGPQSKLGSSMSLSKSK